jgi:hypothetical protein
MATGGGWEPEPVSGGLPPPPARSGLVTALAVINFVLGGLSIICGLLLFLGGAFLTSAGGAGGEFERQFEQKMREQGVEVKGGQIGGKTVQAIGAIVMIIATVTLLWGAGAIAGGVGLIGRRNWGKILTLVLAGVAGVLAILSLIQTFQGGGAMGLLNVVIYVGYAVFAFVVLLNPQISREFT